MITIDKALNGSFIVVPIVIGAFLSGILYLSEGSAIPLTIFQLVLIFGFIIFGLKKLILQEFSYSGYGLEKEYVLFFSIIFFSLIYSPERAQGLFYAIRYIILILMTYLIYNSIESKKEFKVICYSIIGIALLIALTNIWNIYKNPDIIAVNYLYEGRNLLRARGTEHDPNVYAITLSVPIMFTINFLISSKDKKVQAILILILLMLSASLLITYSRSGWIAIFIGVIVSMRMQKNYKVLIYGIILFLVLLLFSDSLQSLLNSVIIRIKDIFAGSKDDSSNIRIMLMVGAVKMFLDSYSFGIGFQGFSTKFQEYFKPQETLGVYEPHNIYYEVLAELGIIGFLVFMFLLIKIFKTSQSLSLLIDNTTEKSIAVSLHSSLISYLIFYLFYAGIFQDSIFWILIALIFSFRRIYYISDEFKEVPDTNSV